uniref:Uncharacterized protein n=1 Tax=viral metagenome TaxID=1070528 RepID=A0A6C0BQC2_9ZZZZ
MVKKGKTTWKTQRKFDTSADRVTYARLCLQACLESKVSEKETEISLDRTGQNYETNKHFYFRDNEIAYLSHVDCVGCEASIASADVQWVPDSPGVFTPFCQHCYKVN